MRIISLALLLLLLLLLACPAHADEQDVHTSREGARRLPLPKADDVFHFVVYGDRTGGPASGIEILRKAVRETNLLDPDLVMTVGDLIQGYNQTKDWMPQMKEFRDVMGGLRMPWYPVAGNHDVYWRRSAPPPGHHEQNYETHFGPLWYWFRHKNAGFVVLYSDEGDPATNRKGWADPKVNRFSATQLAWLEKSLGETRGLDHVFVFLHHPRWRTDYYKGSNWDAAHALLVKAGNVSAVFAGHMHRRRYHGTRDGIEYYTLAAVGGGMPFNMPGTGHLHHMDVVTVRKDGFKIATIPIGSVLDPKEMTPERIEEIDTLRGLPLPFVGERLPIDATGSASGTVTLRIANPVSRPIEVTVAPEARDRRWWIRPDHAHVQIAPGETREIAFRLDRLGGDDLETLRPPVLAVQTDYLGETLRVRLPERTPTVPLSLAAAAKALLAKAPNCALRLDGKGGCIAVSSAAIPLHDGPFTLEGRIRANTYQGRRGYLAKTEMSEYGIFVSNGKPGFSVFLGNQYVSAEGTEGMLKPDRWYHIAGVFDGTEVRLYVDGRLVASKPGSGPRRRNAFPLYIGADPDRRGLPVSTIDGFIDEVRLSNRARYVGESFEPALRHAPDDGTLVLLHLDACVGPFAIDGASPDHLPLQRGDVRYVPLEDDAKAPADTKPGNR